MDLEQRVLKLEAEMREHAHNGYVGGQIYVKNVWGLFQTVTTAGDLTIRLAGSPKSIYEQLFIDVSTGTKKLYIYDSTGATTGVWRSVTIA
jgi:hypothetical protein